MKTTHSLYLTAAALVLLIVPFLVIFVTGSSSVKSASAEPNYDPVTGWGEVHSTGPTSFAGNGVLILRGEEHPYEVEGEVINQIVLESGVIQSSTVHKFTFADGSWFSTVDKGTFVPMDLNEGIYKLKNDLNATDGDYEGKLMGHGIGDFVNGVFKVSLKGYISHM